MTDRNPYDTSIDWLQSQSPATRQGFEDKTQAQKPIQSPVKKVVPAKQVRMPKQKALAMVGSLKKGIVVSSMLSFGMFGLLATGHTVGSTTIVTKTTTPITSSSSPTTQTTTPTTTSSSSSSSNQGGFSFGNSSAQSSSSGTGVS